jgi:hypothetical protein
MTAMLHSCPALIINYVITVHLHCLAKILPVLMAITVIFCAADFGSVAFHHFAVSLFVQLSSDDLSGLKLTTRRCIILTVWHQMLYTCM